MTRTLLRGGTFVLVLAGCAHVEPPSGGPPDDTPPSVFSTRPAADAVLDGYRGAVVFVFDERISERGLDDAVTVSPRTSPVEVRHGRDEVRISLRRGWEPGQIYHVVIRDVVDLFGNRMVEPQRLVFSTGPDIPQTVATGRVTDRITAAPSANVRVEAIRIADSLVYATPTDTAGRFVFDQVPEGDYSIRAFEDVNRDRVMDVFEPQDSARVSIRAGAPVETALRVLMPDTTPPVATAARAREELVEIDFDDYLDPEQTISSAQVTVIGPAGSVPVLQVSVGSSPAPGAAPGAPDGAQQQAADPLPSRRLVLTFSAASDLVAAGEYRVSFSGIRNVNGVEGDSELTFTVVAPNPPEPAGVAAAFPRAPRVATLVAVRSRTAPGRQSR